jgi:hypothetical protein
LLAVTTLLVQDYAEYLVSAEWKLVRKAALQRASRRCQSPICELAYLRSLSDDELRVEEDEWLPPHAYRLEVHHLSYERLGHELPDDLIVLCPACHAAAHGLQHNDAPFTKSAAEALMGAILQAHAAFLRRGRP